MKAIKSDSDSDSDEQKKVARFFRKNRGVTPSLAAPGVTQPSVPRCSVIGEQTVYSADTVFLLIRNCKI